MVPAEAQKGRNNGKVVWRCIRDIQRGWRGLIPLKITQVNDEMKYMQYSTTATSEKEETLF